METLYQFGGYILTSGVYNGREWSGANVMLAECSAKKNGGFEPPVVARVFKASRLDTLMDVVQSLPIGAYVHAYFSAPDNNGKSRLIALERVDG